MSLQIKCLACDVFFTPIAIKQRFCSENCAASGTHNVTFRTSKVSSTLEKQSDGGTGHTSRGILTKRNVRQTINRFHNKLKSQGVPNIVVAECVVATDSGNGSETALLFSDNDSTEAKLFRFFRVFANQSSVGKRLLEHAVSAINNSDGEVGKGFMLSVADVADAAVKNKLKKLRTTASSGDAEQGDAESDSDEPEVRNASNNDIDNTEGDVAIAGITGNPEGVAGLTGATAASATDDAAPETTTEDVARETSAHQYTGVKNETGIMCWLIALSQALAGSFWILEHIRDIVPKVGTYIRPGDALVEVIQRCCNNRVIRPSGAIETFKFGQSNRTLTKLVYSVIRDREMQDPSEGLLKALSAGDSGLLSRFEIPAKDISWFIVAHAKTCKDNRNRRIYRPPLEPATSGRFTSNSVFVIKQSDVDVATKDVARMDSFGGASYFLNSESGDTPVGLLARYVNAYLSVSNSDTCSHCATEFTSIRRCRLLSVPYIVAVFLQKNVVPSQAIDIPLALYLHNWGPVGTETERPVKFSLVAVIHYLRDGPHYVANVKVVRHGPTGTQWLRCNDNEVQYTDGPGSNSTAVGFIFDRDLNFCEYMSMCIFCSD